MIGAEPRTDWLGDAVARDERGYILTAQSDRRVIRVRPAPPSLRANRCAAPRRS